jgi:transposase-like protein
MEGKELTDELIDELISYAEDVAYCFEQGCGTALAEQYLSNARKAIQKEFSALRADLARVREERDRLREALVFIRDKSYRSEHPEYVDIVNEAIESESDG